MSDEIETKATDPTTFTFNWHDQDEFDDWEGFLRWFLIHLVVPSDGDHRQDHYQEYIRATKGFTEVDLKITINGVEGNVQHLLEGIHGNMRILAQRAAIEELKSSAEFRNMRRTMRALEGAVIDRAEQVAREFDLTLSTEED